MIGSVDEHYLAKNGWFQVFNIYKYSNLENLEVRKNGHEILLKISSVW